MKEELIMWEVERDGQIFADAQERLRMTCTRSVALGASPEAVAQTAGVQPDTVKAWIADEGSTPADGPQAPAAAPAPTRSRPEGWVDYTGASA